MMAISSKVCVLFWTCIIQLILSTSAFQINHCTNVRAVPGVSLLNGGASTSILKSSRNTCTGTAVTNNIGGLYMVDRNTPSEIEGEPSNSSSFSTPLDKPILAATDFLSLVVFAGVGKASHSGPDGALDLAAVGVTAFPFLLAWFATSPFTGVYSDREADGDDGVIIDAAKVAAKGWIVAVPLGCALRGVIKGYVPPAPFVIVTMIVTLVLLGGTRMLYSAVEDKISSD